eukprot:1029474-Pyramimonas_sp.AAC.1
MPPEAWDFASSASAPLETAKAFWLRGLNPEARTRAPVPVGCDSRAATGASEVGAGCFGAVPR